MQHKLNLKKFLSILFGVIVALTQAQAQAQSRREENMVHQDVVIMKGVDLGYVIRDWGIETALPYFVKAGGSVEGQKILTKSFERLIDVEGNKERTKKVDVLAEELLRMVQSESQTISKERLVEIKRSMANLVDENREQFDLLFIDVMSKFSPNDRRALIGVAQEGKAAKDRGEQIGQ